MRLRRTSLCAGLAAALATGGCRSDESATGPADELDPSFAARSSGGRNSATGLEAGAASTDLYLVVFKSSRGIASGFDRAVEAAGGSIVAAYPRFGFAAVSGLDDSGAATLRKQREVAYVEPNRLLRLDVPDRTEPVAIEDGGIASIGDPAAAILFGLQWDLRAIFAHLAWAAGKLGSEDVTVAILDTGLDYQNPDLSGRVDLSRSISLIPEDDALVDAQFPGTDYVTDLNFHGTNVGSIVATNAWAFAGVTSMTTLMGVKVCSWEGLCPTLAVLLGIIHAADNGADVINMSLGGSFAKSMFPGFVSLINRVTNYARSRGSLIVVATGNDGMDLDHDGDGYDAYCNAATVVCVSATAPTFALFPVYENVDTPTDYTSYGRSAIDVAAPGGDVVPGDDGWVYQLCSTTSLLFPPCQTGLFVLGVAGTSQAAAHASGVAALIVAEIGSGRPAQVKARLEQTADDLGQPGTDPFFGKGRVNAFAAAGAN